MKNTYKPLLVMTAVAVAPLVLVGCAGGTGSTASSSTTTPRGSGTPQNSSNTDSGGTASASTPAAVLSAWVADVIDGDYLAACSTMALSANGSASGTPVPGTPALCTRTTATGTLSTSPESVIKDLRPSFTPKSLSGRASVTVDPVPATGSNVTVDAKQVSVDGTPLNQVIVSNSSGETAAELRVTFSLTRLKETWYVSNFNLGF